MSIKKKCKSYFLNNQILCYTMRQNYDLLDIWTETTLFQKLQGAALVQNSLNNISMRDSKEGDEKRGDRNEEETQHATAVERKKTWRGHVLILKL